MAHPRLQNSCLCGNNDPVRICRLISPDSNNLLGIYCTVCKVEWLKAEYVFERVNNAPVDEGPEIFGNQLERANIVTNYDNVFSERTRITHSSHLKRGDHYIFEGNIGIREQGIVNDTATNSNRFEAITWTNIQGREEIHRKWIDISNEANDLYRIDSNEERISELYVELVIARAFSLIGTTDGGIFDADEDHFAVYCRLGNRQPDGNMNRCYNIVCKALGNIDGSFISFAVVENLAEMAALYVGGPVCAGALVLAIRSGFLICDVYNLYQQRRQGSLTLREFVEQSAKTVIGNITRGVFQTVGLATGTYFGNLEGTDMLVYVGGLVGGVIGSIFGEIAGHIIAESGNAPLLARLLVTRDDRVISENLEPADVIVVYNNMFHWRCYWLVIEQTAPAEVLALRFHSGEGVVELRRRIPSNACKVDFNENECYPPNVAIQRGRALMHRETANSFFWYNCWSFIRNCKLR